MYSILVIASPLIAFERSGSIWLANLDGSHARKIAEGYMPEISPDGKYIAYNITENNTAGNRYLAIVNTESGKVTQLRQPPSQNNFNPVWSSDSKKLLFNTFLEKHWYLAVINADGTHYHQIKNTQDQYSPAWAKDGTSFFSHDLYSIFWMDLEGTLIKKWRLDTIIPQGNMSSGSRISVADDGKTLLMDVDMDEPIQLKHWDGPPSALWMLDLRSGKTRRLTAKGVLAWNPFWINSDDFLFLGQKVTEKNWTLYRGSRTNSLVTSLFLTEIKTPSASR